MYFLVFLCFFQLFAFSAGRMAGDKIVIFSADKENRHYNMYGKKPRLVVNRG